MKSPNRIRRTARIVALAAAVLFLCLLLAAVVLMAALDDDDYQQLAEWSVKQFTGCRMIVEGPFTVDWSAEPSLSAAGIRFEAAADGPQPSLTAIGQFHVKVALKPLLLGRIVIKKLRVDDVLVSIDDRGAGEDAGPQRRKPPPDIIIPIFESVVLQNIQVNVVDPDRDRKVNMLLRQLTIDDVKDAGPLFVKGEGAVNANDFQIEGRLGALADIFKKKQPYPVELELKIVDFRMTVSGTVDHLLEGEGLNLHLSAEEQDLSNLLDTLQLDVPAIGRLKFAATLSGDAAAPAISGLNLDITDGTSVKLLARGSIANLFSGTGTYISIDEVCTNKDLLKLIFPDNWKVVDEFRFAGTLGNIEGDYTLEDIEALVVNDKSINLKAAGWLRFGDLIDGNILKAVDVNLNLASPHTDALRPLLTDEIPEFGSVTAEGRLTGPVERLALEDLLIRRGGTGPVQVISRGRIGWISLEDDQPITDIDLDFSIQAEQSKILSTFYGVPIGEIGSVSLTGRVTGSTDRFQISDLQLRTADAHGLKTALSGGIAFAEQQNGEIIGDVNCKLRIDAPDMKAAEPLIGATLFPGLGPVSAEAVVTGTTDVLVIEDISVIAGRPERVQIKSNGRIGQFPLTDDQPFSDVKTVASLQAADTHLISKLLEIPLPDLGTVDGRLTLSGGQEALAISDIDLTSLSPNGLEIKTTGAVGHIGLGKETTIKDVGIQLTARAPDVSAVPLFTDWGLPELGQFQLSAQLKDREDGLDVERFEIRTGTAEKATLRINGRLNHLQSGKHEAMDLQADFEALSQPWLQTLFKRSTAESPQFNGSIRLALADDPVRIDDFKIGTAELGGLSVQASGTVNVSAQKPEIDVDIISAAGNPSAWGPVLGVSLARAGPLTVNGRYSRQADKHIFKGETRIGSTQFQTNFRGAFDRQRPGMDLVISAATVDLEDLGLYPEAQTAGAVPLPPPQIKKDCSLFDEKPLPFDALQAFDFSLRLIADRVLGKNVALNQVGLDVILENGRLRIGPTTINYREGFMSIEAALDASSDAVPEMGVKITAEDLDIGDMLSYLHEPLIFEGQLNLVVDLRSAGRSIKQIASGLTGELGVALENGRIQRIINLLAADALDFLFTAPVKNTYTDKKVPLTEAATLAGQIFVPFVALPARALGYLWSLIRNDKDENSPCISDSLPSKSQESIER